MLSFVCLYILSEACTNTNMYSVTMYSLVLRECTASGWTRVHLSRCVFASGVDMYTVKGSPTCVCVKRKVEYHLTSTDTPFHEFFHIKIDFGVLPIDLYLALYFISIFLSRILYRFVLIHISYIYIIRKQVNKKYQIFRIVPYKFPSFSKQLLSHLCSRFQPINTT